MSEERCAHENFSANVNVGRITNEAGIVTSYMADIMVECANCGRQFQFLGLPAGVDMQGAMVSPDGKEARLALCPAGEVPSALDRIAVHFPTKVQH